MQSGDSTSIINERGVQAVGGLLLTGAGLSMAVDAGFVRMRKGRWVLYGIAALVVSQVGLGLVVGSTRYDKGR